MIKTKIFEEGYDDPDIDKQINKWIAVDPNSIILVGEKPKETGNNGK